MAQSRADQEERAIFAEVLRAALEGLSNTEARILVLWLEGMSGNEIGELFRMSPRRLAITRKLLKTRLRGLLAAIKSGDGPFFRTCQDSEV